MARFDRSAIERFRRAVQDRLWAADEKWAADRGLDSYRSPSGWSVVIRDPRFDLRQECRECTGTGHDRITGEECTECEDGVVTLDPPEEDER